MSIYLLAPSRALRREGCPKSVIAEAVASLRSVAKVVWDEPDTPEHCRNFVQWSVRPYRVTDRCDGTRDNNALLVCVDFCKKTGIDLAKVYSDAYPDEANIFLDEGYLSFLDEHRSMTEIPEVTDEALKQLLASLYEMNWRSLVDVLEDRWCAMGFSVDEYWEANSRCSR